MNTLKSLNKWFNNVGRVIKKKNGGYFMVFERAKDKDKNYRGESPFPIIINEGDIVQLRLKKDDLANLVKEGKMRQETADKIYETVKFELNFAPARQAEENKKEADQASKDEVNF